jgi:hypothetical protein
MTKHRTSKRRSQKGGAWYNPGSWFGSSDPNAPKKSVLESITGATNSAISGASGALTSATNSVTQGASNLGSSISSSLSKDVNLTSSTPTTTDSTSGIPPAGIPPAGTQPAGTQPAGTIMGGRRRRKGRGRTMRGGKDGLGLTYYASPVSGLKVAEPTYWINSNTNQSIKGGSKSKRRKSSRKNRKSRRHRKH